MNNQELNNRWTVVSDREAFSARESNERHARRIFALCAAAGIEATLFRGIQVIERVERAPCKSADQKKEG